MKLLLAIRLLGEQRGLFYVSATNKGDFYAFLQHTPSLPGLSPLDRHASYHRDGRRHFRVKEGSRRLPTPEPVWLQATGDFHGAELLIHAIVWKGQFRNLKRLRRATGHLVSLDADAAGFRDDAFFARVLLLACFIREGAVEFDFRKLVAA